MTPEKWHRIKQIFESVLTCDPQAHDRMLDEACGADEEMRAELEKLLAHRAPASDFLESPPIHLACLISQPPPDAFSPGDLVSGRYKIVRLVGRGGMGEVYQAEDQVLGGEIAIKTIRHEIASDAGIMARFRREIQLSRRVTHMNVCRVFDIASCRSASGTATYLTMEMLHGKTLSQLMERAPLPLTTAAPLIRQMAEGLAAAHEAGIIHRDFKPSNVILTQGRGGATRVVITDFGIACMIIAPAGNQDLRTGSHTVIGTPAYMAPEQLKGGATTAATDIFALGLVIYEMLTGAPAFPGASSLEGAMSRLTSDPIAPDVRVPNLDVAWQNLILRCLDRDSTKRFQSAAELLVELPGRSGSSESKRAGNYSLNSRGRRMILQAVLLIVLVAVAIALVFSPGRFLQVGRPLPTNLKPPIGNRVRQILVGDIENRTGDAVLDHTIRELLASTLEQSSVLRVFPTAKLPEALHRMGKPASLDIGTQTALDLCQREGLQAAIIGSVTRIGDAYLIILRAIDPLGEEIGSVSQNAPSLEKLIASVEEAAKVMRKKLGESATSITGSVRLEQVTSPSLQAVQYYSLGKFQLYNGDPESAIHFFQRAIETDREFAMAHCYAGIAYQHLGDMRSYQRELSTAVTMCDRVAEAERLKILGEYAFSVTDYGQALKYFKLLSRIKPDLAAAHLNAGQAYLGQLQFERALAETEEAIRIEPEASFEPNAAEILFLAGRSEQARDRAQRALKAYPDDARALYILGRCDLALGNADRAQRVFERICDSETKGRSLGCAALADLALARGQTDEAQQQLHRAIAADENAHNTYRVALRFLALEAIDLQSDLLTKSSKTTQLVEMESDDRILVVAASLDSAGNTPTRLNDIIGALRSHRNAHQTPTVQSFLAIAQSILARSENKPKMAVEFGKMAVQFENSTFSVDTLGRAYSMAGMYREAIAEFEKVLSRSNERVESYDGPAYHRLRELHDELTRLYRTTGDPSRAEIHRVASKRLVAR